jgi:Arc/MetJ-type ribon-helix-helix transcriptional regulator
MKVELTPEQADLMRHAVESGRISHPEQAVQQALDLWVDRERRRTALLASLDVAEASLARGEGIEITEQSMKSLAGAVMEACRDRLAGVATKTR